MADRPTKNTSHEGRKWLKGVTPDDRVSDAARISVAARLDYVAAYLPLAASPEEDDPKAVHQLRVGCRRAVAALAAFHSCLPRRRYRKLRRRLRTIRRTAGAARDLDVLIKRLSKSNRALTAGETSEVLEHLAKRRADAQPPLVAVSKKLPIDRLERKVSHLVDRIRWRGAGAEPTIRAFAEDHVRGVAGRFLKSAEAITPESPVAALHELRIVAKRLRYTIELYACAADGALRHDVYPLVVDLQERLGVVNDHACAEAYFRACAQASPSSGLKGRFNRLANRELQAALPAIEAFHRWWNSGRLNEIYAGAVNAFPPPTAA